MCLIDNTSSNASKGFRNAVSETLTDNALDIEKSERTGLAKNLVQRYPVLTGSMVSFGYAMMRIDIGKVYLVERIEATSICKLNQSALRKGDDRCWR